MNRRSKSTPASRTASTKRPARKRNPTSALAGENVAAAHARELAWTVERHLEALVALELIAPLPESGHGVYTFADGARDATYARMLFAQRRQLHRQVAQWYERVHAADPAPHYPTLARHWRAADEPAKAIHYLEKAGERARLNGAYEEAQRYFQESRAIDRGASVLSSDYASPL